jgi:hypothetical protein
LTEEEKDHYEYIGAYPTQGGIEDFDIDCQNKRELCIRVKETASKKGFTLCFGK